MRAAVYPPDKRNARYVGINNAAVSFEGMALRLLWIATSKSFGVSRFAPWGSGIERMAALRQMSLFCRNACYSTYHTVTCYTEIFLCYDSQHGRRSCSNGSMKRKHMKSDEKNTTLNISLKILFFYTFLNSVPFQKCFILVLSLFGFVRVPFEYSYCYTF